MKKMENTSENGFTLIELLVTVAIIGILAAISIPLYIGQQKKAAMSEAQTNLQNLRLLEEQAFADTGLYPPDSTAVTATYDETNDLVAHPNPVFCAPPVTGARAEMIICVLPRFRPGNARDLKYDYVIHSPARLLVSGTCTKSGADPNAPPAGSFTACAMPKDGTPVAGTAAFWINDRNQSNIQ